MLLRPPTAQKPWQRALSFAYSTRDGTNDRSRNHAAPGLAFALHLVPRGRWGELPLDLNAFQVAANAHRAADLGTVSVQHGCQRLFLLRWNYFVNFRTDSRKRDALPRYIAAVIACGRFSRPLLRC
jgi:hypothetical protein